MSFPRYPEYKDSGVEWLGEVPAHWEVTKLSYITNRIGSGKTPSGGAIAYVSSGVPFIRSQNVHDQGLRLDDIVYIDEATDREMAWSRVRPLDVLINITGASIGRSCQVPAGFGIANVNQHVCVIRLDKPDEASGWVAWAMKAPATKEQVKVSQTGAAREGLNFEQLAGFYLCMPTLTERRTISAFLDHETARIDALVEEQQRLIELLKEKRQAVISHAVTKGLDPDVPMKDSGVEWLGEVPAHWEVMKFVRCVDIAEGQVDPKLESHRGKILIAPNHIESATGRILYLESAEEQGAESGKYVCRPRDVIYCKIRPALRKACILGIVALCSADMYPLRPFDGITSEFLLWTILSEPFSRLAVLESERVAMPKINRESLNEIYMAIPPANEQEDIDRYISEETCRLDKLTSIAEDSVRLLAERRSALISAAVTGKIDVRGWQPPAGSSATSEHTQTELV